MKKDANAINWFEIPVTDMERAQKFYETIFQMKMEPMPMPGFKMVAFPVNWAEGHIGGALAEHEMYKPSADGVVLYLNANPSIQLVIDRIEAAGGKIVIPKTQISPEIGYMAFFTDTEGNRIALHASA